MVSTATPHSGVLIDGIGASQRARRGVGQRGGIVPFPGDAGQRGKAGEAVRIPKSGTVQATRSHEHPDHAGLCRRPGAVHR